MKPIAIAGTGAVSPAGWGVPALMEMLDAGVRPPLSELSRERRDGPPVVTPVLRVPGAPSGLPRNPRLRRVSPISKFAAAAAIEALGPERIERIATGDFRLGVICSLMNGCVNYSNRFFGEVVSDPSVASPILFPETVFNAPSSHLSAMFASTAPNDTLLGDGAEVFTALELAAEWLQRGDCDGVLVVAPEEIDWLSAEALQLYSDHYVPSEGAGAIYLEPGAEGPLLLSVPDPVALVPGGDRAAALEELSAASGASDDGRTLLADSRTGVPRYDDPENRAFASWQGRRISVKKLLGESYGATSALQLVAAVALLGRKEADRALVTALGGNEQAAGCWIGQK
ncbi:beta-ketoacyl synthase N-terminal-like domain-containing protein [Luteolibacter marinus]|uniref:beta-ketoacyl synthase N-terminal-like domain-containing protein n=1 Tax=Luteolibacter marinus TaxID=2776705 RepID=UPI001868492B|nr:beta-ketoacyl synthase N-terminal-like domain-containing protein [Luteolibacter marinus]